MSAGFSAQDFELLLQKIGKCKRSAGFSAQDFELLLQKTGKCKRSVGFSAQDFELLLRECSVFAERMCGRTLVSVSTRVMTIQISFDVC